MTRLRRLVVLAALPLVSLTGSSAIAQFQPSSNASSVTPVNAPAEQNAIAQATSQRPNIRPSQTLKVGTKEIVPFVFLGNNLPYGYSIELWEALADNLDLKTEWVRYNSVADMLAGLDAKEIDVAVAGISITAEREANGLDFSYPFYRSGLQLMVQAESARWYSFLGWHLLRPFILVMATSAIVGGLIWTLEHKHNENFSNDPAAGIGQGIWFAVVTLGTFGYGDVTPVKLPGRIIACVWMGVSFFIVADFIASLTVGQLAQRDLTIADLKGESVAVVSNTTAQNYILSQPVQPVPFASFDKAKAALEKGAVTAILHDYPTLQYWASRNPDTFELAGDPLTQEDYGIAFREEQGLLQEQISQEILSFQETGVLRSLREKWFAEE